MRPLCGFSGVLIRRTSTWLVPATTPRNQLPATNTRMIFEIRTTYWLGDSTTHVLKIVQFLAGFAAGFLILVMFRVKLKNTSCRHRDALDGIIGVVIGSDGTVTQIKYVTLSA